MKNKSINQNNSLARARRIGTRIALAAFGLLLFETCTPHALGWGITWSDEFTGANSGAQPWVGNWQYELYTGGNNGEVQTYVNSWANSHMVWDGTGTDSQALQIEAQTDTGNQWGHWYSARIDSNWHNGGGHTFGTGTYLEFRCKFPNAGKGYWPACWCLGTTGGNWPANGEIDVAESANNTEGNWQTLHMPGWNPGTFESIGDATTAYHDYGVWIQGDGSYINFVLDGNTQQTIYRGGGGTWEFNPGRQFYIIINLAIGSGGFAGPVDGSTQDNGNFDIDYVRQWN
jgi:hypothetical protein